MAKEEKQYSPVNSQAEENGALNERVQVTLHSRSSEYSEVGSACNNTWCYKSRRGKCDRRQTCSYLGIASMVLNFLLMIVIISLAVRTNERCPDLLPHVPADPCIDDWIWFQRKCYYFSTIERNWTSSSIYCSSHNASLVVVDSQEEMDFLLSRKGSSDHWIGLQKDPGQPWRWVNGSIFEGELPTERERRCAYLNEKCIAMSGCTREERWICNKPAERHCINWASDSSSAYPPRSSKMY